MKQAIESLIAHLTVPPFEIDDESLNDDILEALGCDRATFTRTGFYRPRLLRDLYAALNFIPLDVFWTLAKGKTRPTEPLFGAAIYAGVVQDGALEPLAGGESDVSPAVALTIALLRLRLAESK